MMTLLSLLGGGVMRLLPEIMKLFTARTDNAHELAMMDKQIELKKVDQTGAQHQMDAEQIVKLLDAQQAALTGQAQRTGFAWVDALNFLVRPLTTYYFLGCYGIVKTAMIVTAMRATDPWTAIIHCWNDEDAQILSGILAFWFVGRVFEKAK